MRLGPHHRRRLARAVAPAALGALTGLTRCLFTLGYCALPASLVPLLEAGGLIAPCALVAALFGVKAALLQLATRLPNAADGGAAAASERPPHDADGTTLTAVALTKA